MRTVEIPIQQIHFDPTLSEDDNKTVLDLIESLRADPLLHPVTLQDYAGGEYVLVAGKKRLTAFIRLERQSIPAVIFPITMSARECKRLSIKENIGRLNLPWYDKALLEKEFHELQQEIHGANLGGKPKTTGKVGWSQNDTAKALGVAMGSLSEDLFLANAIAANPNLKKVKDRQTALRLVKVAAKQEQLASESLIPSNFEMNQVFLGDSLEILKHLPSNTFDACITDPPWLEYKDEALIRDESTIPIFAEIYRVLKHDSILYAIMSTSDFHEYLPALRSFGFNVQKYPILWHKLNTITHGLAPWQYSRDYEPIMVAAKGLPVLTGKSDKSAIMKYPALHYTKMIHPNEKPEELITQIVSDCTYPGAKILDPFGGSGVLGIVCKKLERSYIIIERDKKSYDNIVRRLA